MILAEGVTNPFSGESWVPGRRAVAS
jgi:hypothetical protein